MNQNIKYTICFLCGILIAHFLLKKNIEGLCPDVGVNASHVSDCNAVSQDCLNSYSGSGAASVSCYLNGSSCNASSVNCSGISDSSDEEEDNYYDNLDYEIEYYENKISGNNEVLNQLETIKN